MFKEIDYSELVVGFSTNEGIIAKGIRLVERSPFSHTYVRYKSQNLDRDLIYQSCISGVNFTNKEWFLKNNQVIEEYAFILTDEEKKRVVQTCIDRLSLKYGKLQLVGMGLVRLYYKLTGKWTKNPFADKTKTQVCSELVGHVLISMGYPVEEHLLEIMGPAWLSEKIEGLCKLGHCRKL